ncbi:hypothetical protein [Streptomyces sp. NPDC046939]|uniref:cyanobactin maturation protease PatG family protein n=1 Tax=Streptomyces sp. NPDC046939 TaxID=3155376 RepID=UPI0033C4B5D6
MAVYAVGRLAPRFASLGAEKEFDQLSSADAALGRVEWDVGLLRRVLERPENRYVARQVCWVLTVQDVESYLIVPRDDEDIAELLASLPENGQEVLHVVVGSTPPAGGAVPAEASALGLPALSMQQFMSFTQQEFVDALPLPVEAQLSSSGTEESRETEEEAGSRTRDGFRAVATDVFARFTKRAGNWGRSDEHRALNYVALRYPKVYSAVFEAARSGKSFVGVEARRGAVSGQRRVVAVQLTVRDRRTDMTEHWQCLVDVTDVFPFLAGPLSPVYG